MSTPCCAIDVHTHVVPAHLPDERPEFAGLPWPSIKHTDACHAQVIISGKTEYWPLVMGAIIVALVLVLPDGLTGMGRRPGGG